MIFMLSLAGIPPLAGFFGKVYLFTSVTRAGHTSLDLLWLVILAIGMSAVSLYYYIRVLKEIYVIPPRADAFAGPAPVISQVVASLIALAVIVLGCAPDFLLRTLASLRS